LVVREGVITVVVASGTGCAMCFGDVRNNSEDDGRRNVNNNVNGNKAKCIKSAFQVFRVNI
jgi:hypothetical protein